MIFGTVTKYSETLKKSVCKSKYLDSWSRK